MKIDGCVPCFNDADTIGSSILSLRAQTVSLAEIIVIDDGSTDRSAEAAEAAGARVVRLGDNLGRGAARAAATDATEADLLLSVDATGCLAPDFLESVLPWFEDPRVAAVYGRITQEPGRTAADRWRGRHLYKIDEAQESALSDTLITWGFVARPSALHEVGNFNRDLRHSEDLELGERLIAANWKIAYEPKALVASNGSNTTREVLERYWRWNAGIHPCFSFIAYLRSIVYATKVLAARDLAAKDFLCALISLAQPHVSAFLTLANE